MKLTLTLQAGSIGIGFDGCPVVVRKVVESSPYHGIVNAHKMLVRGVSIPNVCSIEGLHMDASFLITLLKEYSGTAGRTVVLEERPLTTSTTNLGSPVDSDATHTTTTEPTRWKVYLPCGNVGLEFQNAPHFRGPALVKTVDELSPIAAVVIPGLQVDAIEIPDQAKFEHVLSAQRVSELLEMYESDQGRILYLSMPLNEVTLATATATANTLSTNNTTDTNNPRYVPLQGSSVCEITGTVTQMATIRLTTHQTIHAQPATFMYSSPTITAAGRKSESASRLTNDERVHLATYTLAMDNTTKKNNNNNNSNIPNSQQQQQHNTLALAPTMANAKIFVVDLEDYGGTLIVGGRNFLFTADDRVMLFGYTPPTEGPPTLAGSGNNSSIVNNTPTTDTTATTPPTSPTSASSSAKKLLQGNIRMQRVMGKGKVFLTAAGNAVQRTLASQETIRVATSHLAAYQFGMAVSFDGIKGLGAALIWGHGVATLTGPGTVWMESLPAKTGLLEKA